MLPLARNIKRYFSLKKVIITILAVVISVSAGLSVFAFNNKEVVINNDGSTISMQTMKTTVKEVLDQNGIVIAPEDYISMALDAKLLKTKTNNINIKRAVPVNIIADGKTTTVKTYKDTVGEMLEDSSVKPAGLDKLDGVSKEDPIVSEMTIKIVRVKETTVTEDSKVAFEVVKRKNDRLNQGTEVVKTEGKEGILEKQFKVLTEDGKQIAKTLIQSAVVLAPVTKVVEYGTVLNHKTSRGDVIRYSKVISMKATAYTASYKDTGKSPGDPGFGITATGMKVRKGVIAVDPKVIPLGTRVYVEVAGKVADYGYAIAADTGGAIKGNKIDLYFDSQSFVDSWGRKNVKVYILLNE